MSFVHASFRNQNIRATTFLPGEVNTPIMDTRVRPPTAQGIDVFFVGPGDLSQSMAQRFGSPGQIALMRCA